MSKRIDLELAVLARVGSGREMTLREIAGIAGIGKETVRKIEQEALMKIRKFIPSDLANELPGRRK